MVLDMRPAIVLSEGQARWRWSRGYVENVAAVITLAVIHERAARRIYNLAEPEALNEAEWVRQIGQAAGWQGQVVVLQNDRLPAHLRSDANWEQQLAVDTTRIRQELGYAEPVPREEAMRGSVEWERAHPPEAVDPAAFDYAAEDAALAGLSQA
jgi:nucleoside-diphosphate-sugar epimerase